MFNKIKKIFGIEEEAEEPKEAEVNFNEILGFVKQETESKQTDAKNEINGLINEILLEFEKLEQKLEKLKKSEPETQMPSGRKFDFKIRDRFCDNVISPIKGLKSPDPTDTKQVFDFLNECDGVFKKIDSVSPKSSAWLMFLFQEKMKEIGMLVKNIQSRIKELMEFLNSDGRIIEIETSVEGIIKNIEKNKKELSNNDKKLVKIEKEIKTLIEKVSAKKEELLELKNTNELSELNKLKDKIENKRKEALQTEQQISAIFGGVHRIMKKFRYIDPGLDKGFTRHLNSYVNAPAETYINEKYDAQQNIHKILSKINKVIEKKEIVVSRRDYNKWTKLMDILEKGDMVKHKENYLKIQECIKEKEREYEIKEKPFKNKKEKLAKEIEKIESNLHELKNTKNDLKNNKNKFKSNLKNNKNLLESTLSSAVKKVNVRIIY